MKSKLAIALCLIGLVGIWGAAIAGSQDSTTSFVGNDEGLSSSSPEAMETAAVPPAPVEKTGQKTTYGTRDDGKLRKGVAWPNPRFTDNKDGTVTDNLTGLIWLKNAGCTKFWATDTTGDNKRDWNGALTAANKLKSGFCGLNDGSVAGDWRLPNSKELHSLIDLRFDTPALPNTAGTGQWTEGHPFSSVASYYWSSSTRASATTYAWYVYMYCGIVYCDSKGNGQCVWPVRGGQ